MSEVQNKNKRFGYDEVRGKILAGKMDVNTQYPGISDFDLPIFELAINNQDTEFIDFLLQHNVDVNRDIPFRMRAIYFAVNSDNIELSRKLLNAGAVCPPFEGYYEEILDGNKLLQLAVYNNNKEMVKLLLEKLDRYLNPYLKIEAFQFVNDYNNLELLFALEPYSALLAAIDQTKIKIFKKMMSQNAGYPQKLVLAGLLVSATSLSKHEFVEYLIDNDDYSLNDLVVALRTAIGNKNIPIVKLLMRKIADTKASPAILEKVFGMACHKKNIEIIEILIAAGFDVTETFDINNSLHIAIIKNDHKRVEKLIKNGDNIDDTSYFRKTPLILAVEKNNKPVVELLLKNGAKIQVTAIIAAINKNNLELVKISMEADVDINNNVSALQELMKRAVYGNKYKITKYLITRGVYINGVNGDPGPLQIAACRKSKKLMKLLIKNGADVNYQPKFCGSALDAVCAGHNLELATILVEAGANINISLDKYSSLQSAIDHNNYQLAEYLVNHCTGANITCDYSEALICAIKNKRKKIVKLLIKNGANVNYTPKHKYSALCLSIQNHTSEITEILLKAGADINLISQNNTPLMEAIKLRDCKLSQYLIENGADVNVTKNVVLLLNWNFYRSGSAIVSLSLDAGADVNVADENGKTAIDASLSTQNSQTLIQHIIKLKAANLYLIDKNLDAVKDNQFNDFYFKCLDEVEFMKTQRFSWKITFYDVLHLFVNKISRNIKYISKDDIIFDENALRSKFKLYGGIIYYRVLKAEQRRKLLVRADETISDLFGHSLSDILRQDILDYFSDKDLKILCNQN
ncbi:putative ankyrin repeat protein RF_0381 [Microplitis mediator]|uniref:putative ankyrin repeat protein RF_0381 n=1 Tax=Microplitis mediator TaxID=375433 RepID=UPI002552CB3C|nr:putative ankyrin repeat protein RF_0381 [Microplitis mediator]